jgi:hypothetical protein
MAEQQEQAPHRRADVEVGQNADKVTLKAPAEGVTLTVNEAQELAGRIVEASILASGEDPDENDLVRVPMQYIRAAADRLDFEIEGPDGARAENVSDTGEADLGEATTAEVHCWIAGQTQRNAMHIAAGWVAEHGWVIGEVIEQRAAARADFENTEYLQYFEQALVDGEVFLYEIEENGGETEGTDDAS